MTMVHQNTLIFMLITNSLCSPKDVWPLGPFLFDMSGVKNFKYNAGI